MTRVVLTVVLLLAATLCPAITMDIPVLTQTPVIDGKIQPDEIANASTMTSMTVMGGFQKAKDPTTLYAYVSGESLYVGFRCAESTPDQIKTLSTRENGAVFTDDSVQILITGDRDVNKTNYVHFAVNAAGTKYSNIMSSDQPVPFWKAAASRTQEGWDAEVLIPLNAFRASASAPHWRANFARYRPERGTQQEETAVWVDPGVTLHNYQRFGFLRLVNMPFPQLAKAYGMDAESLRLSAARRSLAQTSMPIATRKTTASVSVTTGTPVSPVFSTPASIVTSAPRSASTVNR